MRSFTFDVVDVINADGRCRKVEGAEWIKLAKKMVREGRATLVENNSVWSGYTRCYNYTVTEKVN
jgi:hypothetical protein